VNPLAARLLSVLGVLVAAGLISQGTRLGVDYSNPSYIGQNVAGPSVEALARLDFRAFFAEQPIMGAVSLVLRAPFVALANVFGGNMLVEYRFGSFPCVAALGLLALALAGRIRPDLGWPVRLLTAGLVMAGPMTFKALYWGHPEEALAIALAVGGVLVARRRPWIAALMLGCAIATKQWAILAIVPTLVAAAPEYRLRMLFGAGTVAALWFAPMAIGDLDRFWEQNHSNSNSGPGVTPSSVWWVFGDVVGEGNGVTGNDVSVYGLPEWLYTKTEPIAIAATFGFSILFWLRRRSFELADALTLLAFVMLLRCMLDPLAISYHHLPFYVALAAAEVVRTRGLPALTLGVAGVLLLTSELATSPNVQNAVYLAWTVPLALYLGLSLFAPRLLGALRPRVATAR
jgi:hypothetical protein